MAVKQRKYKSAATLSTTLLSLRQENLLWSEDAPHLFRPRASQKWCPDRFGSIVALSSASDAMLQKLHHVTVNES